MAIKISRLVIVFFLFSSCIKKATLNYRAPKPQLVVEGLLLTDSTPCKITLSYSGLFNKAGAQNPDYINDATVYVKDDSGDSTQLVLQGNGVYTAVDNLQAFTGHSYWLSIALTNGKRYASYPEKILPVQKNLTLDSVAEGMPSNLPDLYGGLVTITTQDPANEQNFYRWISTDYVSRVTISSCGFNQPPCYFYCYQPYNDPSIYIQSDAYINGKVIRYQPALLTPYYYYGKHYIDIKQLSLTKNAYEFFRLYQEQTTRTGSILDPLPAPIQGNIYCVNDSTELALGYFEASDVGSFKFVLAPEFINTYITFMNVQEYISYEGICQDVYPGARKDPPLGWEGAPEYIIRVY